MQGSINKAQIMEAWQPLMAMIRKQAAWSTTLRQLVGLQRILYANPCSGSKHAAGWCGAAIRISLPRVTGRPHKSNLIFHRLVNAD